MGLSSGCNPILSVSKYTLNYIMVQIDKMISEVLIMVDIKTCFYSSFKLYSDIIINKICEN